MRNTPSVIGDEFKTARQHLLKNLDGNIAWKDPAQAERQKERLAALRSIEQQDNSETTENSEQPESETQDGSGSGNSMRM